MEKWMGIWSLIFCFLCSYLRMSIYLCCCFFLFPFFFQGNCLSWGSNKLDGMLFFSFVSYLFSSCVASDITFCKQQPKPSPIFRRRISLSGLPCVSVLFPSLLYLFRIFIIFSVIFLPFSLFSPSTKLQSFELN